MITLGSILSPKSGSLNYLMDPKRQAALSTDYRSIKNINNMDKKRSKPVGQNASKLKSSGLVLSTDVEQCVDLRGLHIDEDRKDKPLLLSPQLMIIVEKFNKLYRIAFEFLMSIAEPINRSHYIHEYQITQMSLYTAMVLQYSSQDILQVLDLLSKNPPPPQMETFIRKHTANMGKARFYLKDRFYWLELDEDVCRMVMDEIARLTQMLPKKPYLQEVLVEVEIEPIEVIVQANPALRTLITSQLEEQLVNPQELEVMANEMNAIQNADQVVALPKSKFRKFKIVGDYFIVTEALINTYVPLIQEFDYKGQDNRLSIQMKTDIKPRNYQLKTIKNFIIQEKARSGLVVLPCGAGKTMVGILCIEQLKCSSLIICDSNVSVDQWKRELEKCTTIDNKKIVRITGYVKDKWSGEMPVVLLSTYSWLIAQISPQRLESQHWQMIQQKEWGICIVDEVHRLPAKQFCNVLRTIRCAIKIGLTATLLREDQNLDNLYYMIGPKLYEENLLDLMNQGFLAKPYIVEILCDMTPVFRQEHDQRTKSLRSLLHTGNPRKFMALQFLIKQHERLGHKIIVFCDSLLILNYYAGLLGYPVIDGDLNTDEKNKIFNLFKNSNEIRTIFVSRVGDTGIDIPQASVGIEIGYLGGSRRQKVQRLGRVMRPKADQDSEISAFFYSLASKDTEESAYSYKRQKYITEQLGLNTELINESDLPYNAQPQKFPMKQLNELELLEQILLSAKDMRKIDVEEVSEEQEDIRIITTERTFADNLTGIVRVYNK